MIADLALGLFLVVVAGVVCACFRVNDALAARRRRRSIDTVPIEWVACAPVLPHQLRPLGPPPATRAICSAGSHTFVQVERCTTCGSSRRRKHRPCRCAEA